MTKSVTVFDEDYQRLLKLADGRPSQIMFVVQDWLDDLDKDGVI